MQAVGSRSDAEEPRARLAERSLPEDLLRTRFSAKRGIPGCRGARQGWLTSAADCRMKGRLAVWFFVRTFLSPKRSRMSTSIAILKVLSAYPDGVATFQALKADLDVLSTREWLARMRALAAKAGPFHLFTDGYATQSKSGWAITAAGRAFLEAVEADGLAAPRNERPQLRLVASAANTGAGLSKGRSRSNTESARIAS